jgi:hypothetical protein
MAQAFFTGFEESSESAGVRFAGSELDCIDTRGGEKLL